MNIEADTVLPTCLEAISILNLLFTKLSNIFF